jgi:hypothetical protein
MFQEKINENKPLIYKISFTLDVIKPFVLLHINHAQDINNPHSLSKLRFYGQYHRPLEDWFKKNCNKPPSKADKLAFIILLSYPKQRVIDATSFDDFRLFTVNDDKKSDFKFINTIDLDYNEEDEFDEHIDCICSKDNLKYVTRVENKYSGIQLYIGSECIKKYKIVSEEEIKKMNDINSKKKERKREIDEGLPVGYYNDLRLCEKNRKIEEKNRKIEEKNRKLEEKNKKERQKIQEKLNTGNYKLCYLCHKSLMNIKDNKNKRICESCVENDIGDLIEAISDSIIKKCQIYDCNNCDNPYNSFFSNNEYLCKPCTKDNKIILCKICKTCVLLDIDSSDLYCENCEKKLFNCIDCSQESIRWANNSDRCQTCQLCYNNKMILQKCETCETCFERKNGDTWKKICHDCFDDLPLCNKCSKKMVIRIVKKDNKNKGRKFYACKESKCKYLAWMD